MSAALLIENSLSDRHTTATAQSMAWMPIVGESIFRFDDSEAARQQAAPCLSFENPKLRDERIDVSSFENKSPVFLPRFKLDGAQQIVEILVRRFPILGIFNFLNRPLHMDFSAVKDRAVRII